MTLLAGCGGRPGPLAPQPPLPHAVQRAAAGSELLYVSDGGTSDVDVFELPSGKLVQIISGFGGPAGECVDARGDVFVVDYVQSVVREYEHGGRYPIRILSDNGYYPLDCAVDPVTGQLAVTNSVPSVGEGPGDLAIYAKARGAPKHLRDRSMRNYYGCAYDDKGDLFVDGQLRNGGGFAFAELPSGSGTFVDINLNQSIAVPAGVQWDGKNVAVGGGTATSIYRFKIHGFSGTKVGETPIGGAADVYNFSLHAGQAVVPGRFGNGEQSRVQFYAYPKGGRAVKVLLGFSGPQAAVVSESK